MRAKHYTFVFANFCSHPCKKYGCALQHACSAPSIFFLNGQESKAVNSFSDLMKESDQISTKLCKQLRSVLIFHSLRKDDVLSISDEVSGTLRDTFKI